MGKFLMKIQLMLMHRITIFVNWIFKSFFNRFISIFAFLIILYIIIFPYSTIEIILIFLISFISSITTVRVGSNLNLNLVTGTLNMCLLNPKEYWKYNYIDEKDKIAQYFKDEFIEGLLKASKYKRTIKMGTHKWVVENISNHEQIKSNFNISIKEIKKPIKLTSEILILINQEELKLNYQTIKEITNSERVGYTVKLRRVRK